MVSVSPVDFLSPAYDLTLALRNDILRIPLGLSFSTDDLRKEYQMIHLGAFDYFQHHLLACLVLCPQEDQSIKMRQVAVAADHQGKGVGRQLVDYAEQYALRHNYNTMTLHARDTAVPFYLAQGYHKKDKAFIEVGIKHYRMYKKLS